MFLNDGSDVLVPRFTRVPLINHINVYNVVPTVVCKIKPGGGKEPGHGYFMKYRPQKKSA